MSVEGVANAFGQAPAAQHFDTPTDPRVTTTDDGGALAEVRPLLPSETPTKEANDNNGVPTNPVDLANANVAGDDDGSQRQEPGTTDETNVEDSKDTKEPEDKPGNNDVSPEQMQKYTQEVMTNGELGAESLKSLAEQLNTSEDVVRFTVKGMQAEAQARTTEVLDALGGAEVYQEITKWAADSLSPEDVEAFNATITSGSTEDIIKATQAIKTKYTEVNGSPTAERAAVTPPASTVPNVPAPNAPKVNSFRNMAEQMHAQRDPRYGTDPAYTQQVYDMVARSNY